MTRFLDWLFRRRPERMPSLCGHPLATRLIVAAMAASEPRSSLR